MHPESPEIGLNCAGAGQNPGLAWLGIGLYDGGEAARVRPGVLRFWNASCLGNVMTSTVRKISSADRAAAAPGGGRSPHMADDDRKRKGEPGGPGTAVITKTKPQTKRPSLYRVLILNDDYTPMEFVVHVLERFFGKDHEAATRIMLHVHHHGIGECGIYTYEVAETKVTQVMDFARKHQHPLQCVMEKK
jgi:ATP-dependent Clp protease adaptor protein ClpS